ncbi:MAG: 3-phosphoserine/phosphohydroxythreonine transaminase [Pirellulaceae bacterium]|jgi:phosphoserine aminotransferase|nr:3-phosphoserine/phosphohydroxythreonine transaminase [Pirellulaceae bacterium]MDP7018193.1 3-phosphoserine/phosphohydroxythreonine transaminase [Pirellulaceae bacterium]
MVTQTATVRIFNFSAGPAVLPLPVLEQIRDEIVCLPGCGASVMEISHRSKQFKAIQSEAAETLARLLSVPAGYQILFLQGGSRLQFSMIPMNLLRGSEAAADYITTGSWGAKAITEARREGSVNEAWSGKDGGFRSLPTEADLELTAGAAYTYITSNETIQGVQFADDPAWSDSPLVCDCSSDFLSRPIDVSRYGLIYACAQKNAGPAGVTAVIISDDLLQRSSADLPGYLNYREHADADSMYNTPPTFAVYVLGLVAKWLRDDVGGLAAMQERNREKARLLYDVIDASEGFYEGHVARADRSLMNVTFRLSSDELDAKFLDEASRQGLGSLAGHRSVKGVRASIYNAMPRPGVVALRDFMRDFIAANG